MRTFIRIACGSIGLLTLFKMNESANKSFSITSSIRLPEVNQPLITQVAAVTVAGNTAIFELIKRQGGNRLLLRGVFSD